MAYYCVKCWLQIREGSLPVPHPMASRFTCFVVDFAYPELTSSVILYAFLLWFLFVDFFYPAWFWKGKTDRSNHRSFIYKIFHRDRLIFLCQTLHFLHSSFLCVNVYIKKSASVLLELWSNRLYHVIMAHAAVAWQTFPLLYWAIIELPSTSFLSFCLHASCCHVAGGWTYIRAFCSSVSLTETWSQSDVVHEVMMVLCELVVWRQ